MKVAAHTLGWGNYYKDKHDVFHAIDEIKSLGFYGVELYEGLSQLGPAESIKGLLAKLGLGLASLSCNLNADEKAADLEEAKLRANYAAEFGVKALMVCGGWVSGLTGEPLDCARDRRVSGLQMKILAKKLDDLAEHTKQYKMDVAFHPHLNTIVETEKDIDGLLSESKGTKLCIDIAHLKAKGENPAKLIRKYKDRLAYVHLKDWDEKLKSFALLGEGCVDIKGVLATLNEVGYNSWLTIELDEPKLEPRLAMQKSLEYVKGIK